MSTSSNAAIELDEARDLSIDPEPELQVIWIECDPFGYERMRDAAAGDVWGERRD